MSYLVRVLKPIIVFLFLAMALITFVATMARLFPVLPSIYWSGEATRYLNFWITCLGIGVALHTGAHFSLTIVIEALPAPLQRIATIISHVGVLILAAVLIHFGIQMITWNFDQLSAAMEIPMSYIYAGIPICGALVFLQSSIFLVRALLGKEIRPAAEDVSL
ncbi:TRAP transporter small permease [Pseudohoeflea coraliihabitans]|uniref:TRAP transporter small permease protein n=1 Tax=Pseudohoeflea coraliihabitans TaxID=2860393 RepID=A0ABS6WQ78_9HYPH|nr:TRAP transporter small permease subunit [Pseudohoeflea sp. DP4N28-3]MBW3097215.1 TRAP transporter small permease [Pseudohoeflea sp. DP4N28-3]